MTPRGGSAGPTLPSPVVDFDQLAAKVDMAAWWLSLSALPFMLFTLAGPVQYRLVHIKGAGLVVLVLLALVGAVSSRLRRPELVTGVGALFLASAVVQLTQIGRSTNWLHGDGTTFSLFLAFGVGLLVLGTVHWWARAADLPDPLTTRTVEPADEL